MLFVLENSLVEMLRDSEGTKQETQVAIHRILESWKFGHHLVLAYEELMSSMIDEDLISEYDKEIARSLRIRLIQTAECLLNLKYQVLVTNTPKLERIVTQHGKVVIKVNPSYLAKSNVTDQPIFLPENITEEPFFRKISQAIMFDQRNNFELSYFPVNGGGGTIFQPYSRYQTEKDRLCLSVSDSDKLLPSDTIGETARRLLESHRRNLEHDSECILSSVFVYEAREIENIIPTNFLYDICDGSRERQIFARFVEDLESLNYSARLYVDVKDGFSMKDIILSRDEVKINYWLNLFADKLENCHYLEGYDCFANECGCIIISGMGPYTLRNTIDLVTRISPQKMNEVGKRNPELYKVWNSIAELFISWFCASKPAYS